MQMCYLMLSKGGLYEGAELQALDGLSLIVAAACHDFDHDGLNNPYHVAAVTPRAVRYSD